MDKELTIQYYQKAHSHCDCGNCIYFKKHIEQEHPHICEYLRKMGIDPLQPYELLSMYNAKEKRIEYEDCAYLVVGKQEQESIQQINGITIRFCSKENYPIENIDYDYYFVCFGPITMHYIYCCDRLSTYEDKVCLIRKAIDEVDPIGLLAIGCPHDEYVLEAKLLAKQFTTQKIAFIQAKMIQAVFKSQFDEKLSIKVCQDIAKRIQKYVGTIDFFKNLEEHQVLKDKITIQGDTITLHVHKDFVVQRIGQTVYINDAFYKQVDEQDLLDCFCRFVDDDSIIYVQYAKKQKRCGYFKEIKKEKYNYQKLKHKKDIQSIFDNHFSLKPVYLDRACLNMIVSKEEIIEMMYNEQVDDNCIKQLYSPDRMKRVKIIKTIVGSYTYVFEKLTLLDNREIIFCHQYAVWEEERCGTASFYETIESLLLDIQIQIKDWIEKM